MIHERVVCNEEEEEKEEVELLQLKSVTRRHYDDRH